MFTAFTYGAIIPPSIFRPGPTVSGLLLLLTVLLCPQNAAMSTAGGSGVTSTSTSKATLKPGTVHVVKPNSKTLPDMIELMVSTSLPPHLPDASVVARCFLTFKIHVATECVDGTLDIFIVIFIQRQDRNT